MLLMLDGMRNSISALKQLALLWLGTWTLRIWDFASLLTRRIWNFSIFRKKILGLRGYGAIRPESATPALRQ
ncbi:hypothetical protein DBR22_04775 [Arthrobacter sp. HMWF013]|nr:hypothetical protein DBR22_04775 [Arthrobacter sp. HMWF013]